MPEIRIIPFTPEYAGELGQLHWQVWEETYRGLIPDAYLDTFTPEKWTEKARRDTLSSFLLFADGELAGFASCSDPARESVPVPEASEIVAFYLLRKFQGQGLARSADAALSGLLHPSKCGAVCAGGQRKGRWILPPHGL